MKKTAIIALWAILAACSVLTARPAEAVSPNFARRLGNAFADAVDKAMPSVVVVRTESTIYHAAHNMLFGGVYGIPEKLAGQGSGVILSQDGYVLTSYHVIARAESIEVVLHDETIHSAELVGRDAHTDLAVLRIKAPEGVTFTPIEAADSDTLRIGEFVIAIGSPFSLSSSVSAGIVSQKGRSVGLLPYEDFIQTDAPINPGSSGGPLVDVEGRMVGINAMIQTTSIARGSVGIGFAVPANLAMHVARSIINQGSVVRPWIGVRLRRLDPEWGEKLLGVTEGVVVAEVLDNTPASRAGLIDADIITAVDGQGVSSIREVQNAILRKEVGEKVVITVNRVNRSHDIELTTEHLPLFADPNR